MTSSKKLSLLSVVLININVMLGSGIFINTVMLANATGSLSPISYLIVGVLLLPIVLSIVKLWSFCKTQATLYQLGANLSPFIGFLSSWCYFIGKISTLSLCVHVCSSILQQLFFVFNLIPVILLDFIFIFIFAIFNLLNFRTGSKIQVGFATFKFVPILFMIFSGLYLFTPSNFTPDLFIPYGIPASLTLVFYAFAGFESTCSLSKLIENPSKNGTRAILISYALVIAIAVLFQFAFCAVLSSEITNLSGGYLGVFSTIVSKLMPISSNFSRYLIAILNLGIAISALGAAYSIMFSNCWNLYTLAQNKHLFYSSFIGRLNSGQVPYVCIIIESIIAFIYILVSQANQLALQQLGALAATIAYTLSILVLLVLSIEKKHKKDIILSIIAVCSCLTLIISFIYNLIFYGISNLLVLFMLLVIFGSYMFYKKHDLLNLKFYQDL